jgi:DNA-binding LacI/PurR family transcriptional regulator/AraC-like DNA-binding protein
MNQLLLRRRKFLLSRKNAGHRITIGFTGIADLRSFISQEYIAGIIKACEDYDINFINMGSASSYSLFDDINFISHYSKTFRFMKEPFVDGMITWASSFCQFTDKDSVIKTFSNLKPLPTVDIGFLTYPDASYIRIDNSISIKLILDHLTRVHKYSRFIFIGTETPSPNIKRLNIYREELKKRNLPELENSVYLMKNTKNDEIRKTIDSILEHFNLIEKKDIDAIITTSDIIAASIIEELNKHNICVPKDIAVTGFNNWYDSLTAISPITTIALQHYERGYSAVELLIDRIQDNSLPPQIQLVPTKLIIRESCGCFEKAVLDILPDANSSNVKKENLNIEKSEQNIKETFKQELIKIFLYQSEQTIENLSDAIFSDLYEEKQTSALLLSFQTLLQQARKQKKFDIDYFENTITRLRNIILPLIENDFHLYKTFENIFHQMRSLITIYLKYENMTTRESPYRMNDISQIAVSLSSVQNKTELFQTVDKLLNELEIPSAIIALNEKSSHQISEVNIEYVYPPKNSNSTFFHDRITMPHLFPKKAFCSDKRFTWMLELLYRGDSYFGYAFLQIKNLNIALYDTFRMLLSSSLDLLENTEVNKKLINQNTDTKSLFLEPDNTSSQNKRIRISVQQITDYLTEHINEKTDIDKMAQKLYVSRSTLMKKTRELTGNTIQEIHEKIKIEKAKQMLCNDNYTLAYISKTLGFSNQNYFSTVFKKITGLSPRNFLKETE